MGRKSTVPKNVFIPDTKVKTYPAVNSTPNGSTLPNSGTLAYNQSPTFKRMDFQEMQVRKAKGLCFTCDDKYSPTHNCLNKLLLLLQWDDTKTENSNSDFLIDPHPTKEVQETTTKLSLNPISSSTVFGIKRFKGFLGSQQINILLDGGSDDTFIQPRVVNFCNWMFYPLHH